MEEQPIVAGLLLEVRTVRGLRYVQVASSSTARYAPSLRSTWVRVLPGEFTRRPTELSIVAALDEEYFVLLGYAETIPIPAQIEVVAFESVPAGHDRPGLVRALASPKDGRVRWRVSEPGNESVLVDGDALSDEQANASLSTLLSTDDLVQVLNADWHPRRAVLTGRVPRKESAEDAPALDWTYDFTVRFPLEAHAIMFASQLRRRIPALHVMIAPRLARHEVTVFGHEGDPRGTEDAIRELANAGKGEIVHSGRRLDG